MENTIALNDLMKERHKDYIRAAERTRRILRSKKLDKLPRFLKDLVIILLSVA